MAKKRVEPKGQWLQQVLIVAFVGILVLLPFHALLSTWAGHGFGAELVWKSWKELLLVALVPLVAWYCVVRPDVAATIWRFWLTKLVLAYVVLHFAFAIVSQASTEAILAGLLMNLRFLALLIVAQILLAGDHPWLKKVKHWLPNWLFVTTIVLSVLAVAQVSILPRDFLTMFGYGPDTIPAYLMVDENPNALRGFATMRGPNPFGAWLLLPLALAAVTVMRQRRNMLAGAALGFGIVALIVSGSRSAWLGALAGAVVLALILVPREKVVRAVKFAAIPTLVLGIIFLWLATTVPALRLAVFRSSPGDASLLEGSTQKHWEETVRGVQDVAAHPLGQGVGTAGPASFYNQAGPPEIAENYFIQIAQEVGVFGLGLFVAISGVVVYRLWRLRDSAWQAALLASFAGMQVINLFLHGWADDPTAMTWWAIAGLYLFAEHKKHK
ncbi:MAG TPA: O-antigen ligase family protein [Candidatus Saccharimonadales bacterium]|nr:O-antigen ligase family protein [Candidatus Saccharimonadales bacterium]